MLSAPLRISVLLFFVSLSAHATTTTFGFSCITSNSGTNSSGTDICGANVAPQMFVDVIGGSTTSANFGGTAVNSIGTNQVLFVFRNTGPNASSITDVYFDDGSLLGIASIIPGTGVAFSPNASPRNLPSGNNVKFSPSTDPFSADSNSGNPGAQANGVNPGEALGVLFNLKSGQVYANVLAAFNLSLASPGQDVDGGLRVGIHVQGLAGGQSESLVNGGCPGCDDTVVPEPGFYGILSVGLVGLYMANSKLRRKSATEPNPNA